MPSGVNRIILAQETLKGGKKGKGTFDSYAKRVTKNANKEVTGKEDLCGKKK